MEYADRIIILFSSIFLVAIIFSFLISITELPPSSINDNISRYDFIDYKEYLWINNNSQIDNDFIKLCNIFSSTRKYINGTYNCVNFSIDFSNLAVLNGYPVSPVIVCNNNQTDKECHMLTYFEHNDTIKTYIEPQTCAMFYKWELVTNHYYNYTEVLI